MGSFAETAPHISAARLVMTDRTGRWVTKQVGRWHRSVNELVVELGCDWHTINDTVLAYGAPLVDDPDRIGAVEVLGLASEFVTRLGADLQDQSCPPEVRQLGRTIARWASQIAAWHRSRVSNGPTESNNLIKRVSPSDSDASGITAAAPCSTPANPTGNYSPPSPRLPREIRSACCHRIQM